MSTRIVKCWWSTKLIIKYADVAWVIVYTSNSSTWETEGDSGVSDQPGLCWGHASKHKI